MKNTILILIPIISLSCFAKEFKLTDARAEYEVKHLVKTVKGESKELKGKMVCEKSLCDFLVAIPVKSFVSSDSNRDLNMQTILEVTKYPLITVKGKISEQSLSQKQYEVKGLIGFHGVEKEYFFNITTGNPQSGEVVIKLEDHNVKRPSLLTVSIDNEVPVRFSFNWKE